MELSTIESVIERTISSNAIPSVYCYGWSSYTCSRIDVAMQSKKVTSNSEKNRLAEEVVALWVSFQMALSNKRKYPAAEFTSFVASARRYLESIGQDALIHREVVNAIKRVGNMNDLRQRLLRPWVPSP